MIVVPAMLVSAVSVSRNETLCFIEIVNVSGAGSRRDYVVRLYSRGKKPRLIKTVRVENWPAEAKPAWRLIQAAWAALD